MSAVLLIDRHTKGCHVSTCMY